MVKKTTIKYKTRKTQQKLQRKQKKISSQKGGEINTFMSLKIFTGNGAETVKNMYTNFLGTVKNTYKQYSDRLNKASDNTQNILFGKISNIKKKFNKSLLCITS